MRLGLVLATAATGLVFALPTYGAAVAGTKGQPKAWVGRVTGTANNPCCSSNITMTWTVKVRFVLTTEPPASSGTQIWGYEAASGSVKWNLYGKSGPCTVRGGGTVPILPVTSPGYERAINGTLFLWKKHTRYSYIADLTGVPEERSPITKSGCEGGGRRNQVYFYTTLPHTDKAMRRNARTLAGSDSRREGDATYRWSWSLTAVN